MYNIPERYHPEDVITLRNATGGDATPNRGYRVTPGDFTFKTIGETEVGLFFGILLPDRNYASGLTPNLEAGSILLPKVGSIVNLECGDTVTAGKYVRFDSVGRVVMIGAGTLNTLSLAAAGTLPKQLVGYTLEGNTVGYPVAVYLCPQLIWEE